MPTISAKIIRNPRKVRKCDACGKAIIGASARLFGSCEGDKPYAVYMHPECVQDKGSLQKLHAAEQLHAPDLWVRATPRALSNLEIWLRYLAFSTPAHKPVTQAVGKTNEVNYV